MKMKTSTEEIDLTKLSGRLQKAFQIAKTAHRG